MRLEEISFPPGSDDEKELLLQWLNYLRGAVLRDIEGLDDAQARWTPNGKLIPLLGIVNHLAKVEWRWIEGGFSGADVSRTEKEFTPGQDVTLREVIYARGYSSDRTTPGQSDLHGRSAGGRSMVRGCPRARGGRGVVALGVGLVTSCR
jgi:hypothetical protein